MQPYLPDLFHYILNDIREVLRYLPIGLATVLFVMVIAGVLHLRTDGRKTDYGRRVCRALLAGYAVVLVMITFLSREPGARDGMDLVPFATVGNSVQGDAYVAENVLLFIPFGMLLPAAFQRMRRFWPCVGLGFLVSMMIETSQFLTKRGFVQTDDVITNTLGAMIGYGIAAWLLKRYGAKRR